MVIVHVVLRFLLVTIAVVVFFGTLLSAFNDVISQTPMTRPGRLAVSYIVVGICLWVLLTGVRYI